MSELTEEQLRDWRDGKVDLYREQCTATATELLALRAGRAKPTQSDEERGEDAYAKTERRMARAEHDPFAPMRALIASIRAEGSAGHARLEADLEYRTSQRDNLYDRVAELDRALTVARAERAKLEAALNREPSWPRRAPPPDDAQPAESGATDAMRDHEDRAALHNRILDEEREKAGDKLAGSGVSYVRGELVVNGEVAQPAESGATCAFPECNCETECAGAKP